jgi:predicted TIM-barrel fold metal-dependent hydrolase
MSDLDLDIKKMDEAGVDVAVLSLGLWHVWMDMDRCKFINDETARAQRHYGGRIMGMAHVPPLHPDAPQELERAIRTLDLRAVHVLTHWEGLYIDDPAYQPFFAKVEELGVPVFVHPNTTLAEPFAKPYTEYNLLRSTHKQVDRHVCVLRVIYSGMLARHPKLVMVHSHVGGYFLFEAPQIPERINRMQSGSEEKMQFDARWLDQLYFDMAGTQWNPPQLMGIAFQTVGADRLLFGSDWPSGPQHMLNSVARLRNAPVDWFSKNKVFGENARRIIRLD